MKGEAQVKGLVLIERDDASKVGSVIPTKN
jgi:hypothetical protein